jgi:membrane protein implicated in regulation of membrane protease activity
MPAWIWLVLGISLVIVELLLPSGFFLFILGIAGIVVGAFVATGVISGWMPEVVVFCVVAIGCWLAFGKHLVQLFSRRPAGHQGQLVGSVVSVTANIPVGSTGTGTLWGTQWRLENIDSSTLTAGSEAVVVSSQGITLQVKRK